MHLVLANQWYPPESGWGGVGMWNHAIANAYRELGHHVTVIASRTSADIPAVREEKGLRVIRLLVRDAYRWRRLPGVGRYVRPLQQLAYAWHVDRALRELHAHQPIDAVEFAEVNAEGFFYARAPQAPVIVRCHTPTFVLKRYYTAREMPYDTRIISWCEKDLIRRAHALTAPSCDLARVIASECRVPLQDIAVIPNALSISQFSERRNVETWKLPALSLPKGSNVITILHVGRLERVKGVTVLADAIPQVLAQIPNAHFVFIGADLRTEHGASQRAELEKQLTAPGVSSQVEFLGGVDQPTLWEWYRRADICIVPSLLYESFSYTCAQAMAAGKPVVASRIGGIPETVDDGATGILAEPGNVAQLADAIVRLARDSGLRERLGNAGQEKGKREFDPLKIARQNLEVYAQAIATFKR